MAKVLIASTNPSKLAIYRRLLTSVAHQGVSLHEAGMTSVSVDEVGETAEENAIIKANEYYWQSGMITLADDTAMMIHGLNGKPGVQVRRWNGVFADNVSDDAWLTYFLSQTEGIEEGSRTGTMQSVCCLIDKAGCPFTFTVERPFTFAREPVRPISPGWPMSAIIDDGAHEQRYETYEVSFLAWLETYAGEINWGKS